jgi:molybdate transport system substrate-binding protein
MYLKMSIGQDKNTRAGSVTGISSMATRELLSELLRDYGRISGCRIVMESVGGVAAERRVMNGERFDIVVLADTVIDRLIGSGQVDGTTRVELARSGIALAVQGGARRPGIHDEAAVRDAILTARSIGYSTGPSGVHLMRLLERWGIAQAVAQRMVQAPAGVPVGSMVASGNAELGVQQLSELMHVPGIDVIGHLPDDIQQTTVFSAALCTGSAQRVAVEALFKYLISSAADQAKLGHGMEVGIPR